MEPEAARAPTRWWPLAAAAVAAGLSATAYVCCSCSTQDGPDAGDAGADLGLDAGLDAEIDLGADGSRDGGVDGGPPGWTRLDGLPDGCVVEIAANASGAVPPLSFHPCTGITSGCREVTIDWATSSDGWLVHAQSDISGWYDGSDGYFALRRSVSTSSTDSWLVAYRDDGTPVVAVRSGPAAGIGSCFAAEMALGAGRAVFDVTWATSGSDLETSMYVVDMTTPGTARLLTHLAAADTHGNAIAQTAITNDEVVFELDPAGFIYTVAWDGTFTKVSTGVQLSALGAAVGRDVYYTTISPAQISQVRGAGAETQFIGPTADGGTPIFVDTDGHDIVWLEGHDRVDITSFDILDLMTSPYSADSSAVVARRVGPAPMPMAAPPRVGYGHAVVSDRTTPDHQPYAVYRLSDGTRTTLPPPPDGTSWRTYPFYMAPEEMAIAGGPPWSPPRDTHVWIVRYDTFEGPP